MDKLPDGEDLVVERRTKPKTKKKKTPAPVRLAAVQAAEDTAKNAVPTLPVYVPATAITPPLANTASAPSASAAAVASSTSGTKKAVSSSLLSSLMSGLVVTVGESEEPKTNVANTSSASAGDLRGALLSSGLGMEGEEDEQEAKYRVSSSEEGDSLDPTPLVVLGENVAAIVSLDDEEAPQESRQAGEATAAATEAALRKDAAVALENVASEPVVVASSSSSSAATETESAAPMRSSLKLGSVLKQAWSATLSKVSNVTSSMKAASPSPSPSPAPASVAGVVAAPSPVVPPAEPLEPTLPAPANQREKDLRRANNALKEASLNLQKAADGVLAANVTSLNESATKDVAAMVKIHAELSNSNKALAKSNEELSQTFRMFRQGLLGTSKSSNGGATVASNNNNNNNNNSSSVPN